MRTRSVAVCQQPHAARNTDAEVTAAAAPCLNGKCGRLWDDNNNALAHTSDLLA